MAKEFLRFLQDLFVYAHKQTAMLFSAIHYQNNHTVQTSLKSYLMYLNEVKTFKHSVMIS